MEFLLVMADRYDIPKIMMAAEEWLTDCSLLPLHHKLRLSKQYSLQSLESQCLSVKRNQAKMKSDSYKHSSSELKKELKFIKFMKGMTLNEKDERTNDANDAERCNVIRMRVENVKDLSMAGAESEVKRINGFPWQIKVFCRDEEEEEEYFNWDRSTGSVLVVLLECKMSLECEHWHIERAEGEVKIINHDHNADSECENFVAYSLHEDSTNEEIYSCELDLVIEEQGVMIDGSIEIEVMINVKGRSVDRFRKIPQIDFYSPSRFSDIVFVVEGASKQILAYSSSYFEKMFYGDCNTSQMKEIIMEGVSSEDFLVTLEMVYNTRRKFNDNNVELLLRMTGKYEIMGFLDRAEKWLLRGGESNQSMDTGIPMHVKLRLADQYQLNLLKNSVLFEILSR
ncbi:hypothetical protein PENTCL1PPCAC_23540, partial [Pristionchus entomophagus]